MYEVLSCPFHEGCTSLIQSDGATCAVITDLYGFQYIIFSSVPFNEYLFDGGISQLVSEI